MIFLTPAAHPELPTLSLHDALPILRPGVPITRRGLRRRSRICMFMEAPPISRAVRSPQFLLNARHRSEEHTSELQSRPHLVCRLLLEKKKVPRAQHAHHEPAHTALD